MNNMIDTIAKIMINGSSNFKIFKRIIGIKIINNTEFSLRIVKAP